MSALVALAVVVVVTIVERHRRAPTVTPAVWPWLLAEVEWHIGGAEADPCDVVVGVCRHGPPSVRSAAETAARDHAGEPPAVLLGSLCDRLATASGDRLCATAAASAGSGVDPASALARLRAGEAAFVDVWRSVRATLRCGTAGSWLLLSPLAPVAAGSTTGGAAWFVAALAVATWWAGRTWVRAAVVDTRVLTGSSVRVLAADGSAAA